MLSNFKRTCTLIIFDAGREIYDPDQKFNLIGAKSMS
jgi:hypothetical protein